MSYRRSGIVQGITTTDRDLLSDHDESFYCADDLVDSSEDEEFASSAAKRGDNGNYEEITRVMRTATLVNNQLQKFKKRSGETL